jgi:hypothetical protein
MATPAAGRGAEWLSRRIAEIVGMGRRKVWTRDRPPSAQPGSSGANSLKRVQSFNGSLTHLRVMLPWHSLNLLGLAQRSDCRRFYGDVRKEGVLDGSTT